jgi:hypothetical protein
MKLKKSSSSGSSNFLDEYVYKGVVSNMIIEYKSQPPVLSWL